jgi:hypothetical protein
MNRKELNEIEKEEAEEIEKFKKADSTPCDNIDLDEFRDNLIEKIEKDYQILDKKEFKKHNLATLEKIHDALKDDEPEILVEFGIKPKKKKLVDEEDEEWNEEPTI